jgi:uncharacterized protein YjbI with pentapeptide repeats
VTDNEAPAAPVIEKLELTALVDATADAVEPEDRREGERFTDADFGGRELEFTSFLSCEFQRVRFGGTALRGLNLTEVELFELDAPDLSAPRSSWRRVHLAGSRIGAAELYDSSWRSVTVTGSKIGYLNARNAVWQDVVLRDCMIEELDLGGAKITRMALPSCRIGTLHAGNARLTDVDLRGATLGVVDGLGGLGGCWISAEQLYDFAPLFAGHLRINVG